MGSVWMLGAMLASLWLCTRACVVIFHDPVSSRVQKLFQLLIVFLLPVVGALLVLALLASPQNVRLSGAFGILAMASKQVILGSSRTGVNVPIQAIRSAGTKFHF